MTRNFALSYNYMAPVERLAHNEWPRLTNGWRLSGVTQFAIGFPVPISEIYDHSFLGSSGAGAGKTVNERNCTPGNLDFTKRGTGNPHSNVSLLSLEPHGQLGTARRQFFHGPGIHNLIWHS